ncbi:unnamed protein product [Sphagnum balticum]
MVPVEMEESGKFIVEGRGDIMRRLDDDTAIHVLQYLDTAKDIASAAAVCCSWRRFVLEGQLWKGLCIKEFPEVMRFDELMETDAMQNNEAAGSSGSSFRQILLREDRIYRNLFCELKCEPLLEASCIKEAVGASSTDNYPQESIFQTLYPRPRYSDEQTPSYWSSTGERDINVPETLTYNLTSTLCVVHEVHIQPFQAFFQTDQPIYSAQYVRIRLGYSIMPLKSRSLVNKASQCIPAEEYLWMYESPKFSMEQVDSIQVFKLPRPVLCIGGVLQVELLGRVQTQAIDQLYYICICYVSALGRPLSNFKLHIHGEQNHHVLEFQGKKAPETVSEIVGTCLSSEVESAGSGWHLFAERIRHLRVSRVLRRNRLLLNALLGNIAVANLLLGHEDPEDSSSDEDTAEQDNEGGDNEEEGDVDHGDWSP